MDRTENITMTNMCMITDGKGNVLAEVQSKYGVTGIVFPGGHVEPGESIVDSVVREVYEETGLTVSDLRLCGVKDYVEADDRRYMVFLYRAGSFTGEVRSSAEGEVFWTPLDGLKDMNTLWHLGMMLDIFRSDRYSELYFGPDGQPVLK